MQKFIVPTFIEYNACQLSTDRLEDFKKFIAGNAYYIDTTFRQMSNKQIPMEISFQWNPYGDDYPSSVTVKNGQYFLYEEEDKNNYRVIYSDEIEDG